MTIKEKSVVGQTRRGPPRRFFGGAMMVLLPSLILLGLAGYFLHPNKLQQEPPFRVLIIGGGISGLAAAYTLTSSDRADRYSVTLLEAKDRLGGRLHTVMMPFSADIVNDDDDDDDDDKDAFPTTASSSPIDLGGMYWHGSESPAMRFLQSLSPIMPSGGKSNLPGHGSAQWRLYTRESSSDNGESEAEPGTWSTLTASDLERAQALYQQWDRHIKQQYANYAASQKGGVCAALDAETGSCPSVLATEADDSEALLSQWSDAFLGTLPTNDRHLVEFIKTMSFQLDRGVPLEALALNGISDDWGWRDIDGTDHIAKYGMSPVIDALAGKIDMTLRLNERVTRIDYSEEGRCRVETEANRSYAGDACIVTLPIGVMKAKGFAMFLPELPANKQDALQRAGTGTYNTLAVHWNAPVCGSIESTAYYLVGNPDVDNPLRFGFVCSAQLRDPQDRNSITQFYISGSDHPFDDIDYWKEKAVQVVRAGGHDVTLSDIADAHISKWHLDQDSVGSYSASTKQTRGDVDRRILAESLIQTLYFAGEHTHFEGRYQSIDGAFETGQRAAGQLMVDHS